MAWDRFKKGKTKKKDIAMFEWNLEQNIFKLHRDLKNKTYYHSPYHSFSISDPKPRNIHKSSVRDRVLHHAIFQILYPIFEAGFINASFSCRKGYGTHFGVRFLHETIRKVTSNGKIACYALKCDVKKFFDTIDHETLLSIFKKKVKDENAILLLEKVISSFKSDYLSDGCKRGVPIGNLTSQLFANVYMNELDQYFKQKLKIKYYMRYTDDFIVISESKKFLENLIPQIIKFLGEKLYLKIHEEKTIIKKVNQGIDFLGYIVFPHHRLLRTKTKKRILRKLRKRVIEYKNGIISRMTLEQSLQSYLGVLSHANTYNFENELKNKFWFWLS